MAKNQLEMFPISAAFKDVVVLTLPVEFSIFADKNSSPKVKTFNLKVFKKIS